MEIQHSFRVAFSPDEVWPCFHDIEAIVGCLPGAALRAPPGSDGSLALSMTVKLGPIVAEFAGKGEMTLDDTNRRGRITGGGSDRKSGSRIKGEATFCLSDNSSNTSATQIDVRIEYSIAGALAQFSRADILRQVTERMAAQFSINLQRKLENDEARLVAPTSPGGAAAEVAAPPSASTTPPGATAIPVPTGSPAAPVDLGGMFWSMFLASLRRWLRLAPKKSKDGRSAGR